MKFNFREIPPEKIRGLYPKIKEHSNPAFAWFLVTALEELAIQARDEDLYLSCETKGNILRVGWDEPWTIIDNSIGYATPSCLIFEFNPIIPKTIRVFGGGDNGLSPFECKDKIGEFEVKNLTIKKILDNYSDNAE